MELTETAAAAIANLVEGEGFDSGGLRLSAERDEHGEIGIHLDIVEEPEDGDEIVAAHGAQAFLDPSASAALADKVLDVEGHGDHYHFDIVEREPTD